MESDVGTPIKKAKLDSAMAATSPPKQICTSLNTFEDHRQPHMAYVDKTALVAEMVSPSAEKGYFVNRPPKFGKTILLDTIATYFKGDREAFRGLAIYDMQMPWEEFPIIRFSMSELNVCDVDQFEASLCSLVVEEAKRHDVCLMSPNSSDSTLLFAFLIEDVYYKKHEKGVVILIDEYDSPILECLNKENAELGKEIEEILASFYEALTSSSSKGYVRFRYVTGITRLAKDTIGSSLNNLSSIDETSPQLASSCGFTRDEILSTFGPELSEFSRKAKKFEVEAMKDIEEKYNGYNWHLFGDKAGLVFNPYAILCVFKCMVLGAYSSEE
ncbi:uncharacterized protein in vnfD 5'region-like [Oscarella lobularis]|uniref:uncharacterized protein in vnfD 5'region-like n=1 Tax=Oscarella lobularis TaxID=121494 RepID=UPI0033136DF8